ncbi:hypothetical protein [Bosea sp. (in: a-proteobacteria)]|uniref:hypothetical protein n=1 Tax=Bosea sp. (in: a-proteobacteria) TaxID=1871050 RepID=UPI002DDC9C4A|nr:hypothetical protein [Bosea sp. (in: a-proteobacteria)]HEV2508619.1 hypothetical protein [Bosea sp. (in: a-proteobacteria)]
MASKSPHRQPHPCAGLSKRAHEVFEQIAIGNDLAGHHPRILDTLVFRALIERSEEQVAGPFANTTMTISRYCVPLPVHMAWCSWCNENAGDGGVHD